MAIDLHRIVNGKELETRKKKISVSLPSHLGLIMSALFSPMYFTASSKSNNIVLFGAMLRPAGQMGTEQGGENTHCRQFTQRSFFFFFCDQRDFKP